MTIRLPDNIIKLVDAHPGAYQLVKDIVFSLAVVAVIAMGLYLYAGVWTPIVSVDGTSMLDHMHQGDLVLVQGLDRTTVHTYDASKETGYQTYGEYGDVIVYYPYGDTSRDMVIHRAMYWVNESELMWPRGPAAPWSGYITLGDNNNGRLDQTTDICLNEPVKPEWVHGVAKYSVPFIGYLRSLI
jgi:signal peptidase